MVTLVADTLARCKEPSQFDVSSDIDARLKSSGFPQLQKVVCESHGEVIVLRGRVDSFYLKQLAQEIVKKVAPNNRIANLVTVS